MKLGATKEAKLNSPLSTERTEEENQIYNSMQKIIIIINDKICFESAQCQHLYLKLATVPGALRWNMLGKQDQARASL